MRTSYRHLETLSLSFVLFFFSENNRFLYRTFDPPPLSDNNVLVSI